MLHLFAGLALSVIPAAAPPAVQEVSVRELARAISSQKDAVDPAVFDQLARIGDKPSFTALRKALDVLKDPEVRAAAYAAFRHYRDDPKLSAASLGLLEDEVRRAREVAWRLGALRALLAWEDEAVPLLEELTTKHPDAECRTLATDVLLVRLADRGGPDGLRTILENVSLAQDKGVPYLGIDEDRLAEVADKTHRAVVREVLRGRLDEETLPIFAERLAAQGAGRVLKLLLLRLVAERPTQAAGAVLAESCRDRDAAVALLAVDLLAQRPEYEGGERTFRRLLSSPEPALRRAAVLGLGAVLAQDAGFRSEVLALARSGDAPTRMGAAGALVSVGSPEALEALHALLADPEWSVRVEALQRAGMWRAKESIPVLIERLAVEEGRMTPDVQAALVRVTRIDLGRLPGPWRKWWEVEGEAFVIPDRDARRVETVRSEPTPGASVARTFYTLHVLSERVAFVLDISGSMRLRAQSSPGTVERSRMDVAKEELGEVLRQLPDGTLFNVIFFESFVRSLDDHLVKMSKASRARALRFVREQYAVGATALYPALQLTFADPLVDTIYLLSDGAPTVGELTDIEEIRAEVGRWNGARHVRIHGVAMGQDSTLLRWLSEDTGGTYVRVD